MPCRLRLARRIRLLSVIFLFHLVAPCLSSAQSTAESDPVFLGGCGVSIRSSLGQVGGLTEEISGNLRYYLTRRFALESALTAGFMIGWDIGLSCAALAFFGEERADKRIAIGPFIGLLYGSRIVGMNQDDAPLLRGQLGPWPSLSGGLVLSPFERRKEGMEYRVLRLSLGAEYAWGALTPLVELEVKVRLWRIM